MAVLVLCLAVLVVSAGSAPAPPPASGYHLLKKYAIGGEGGWDYLLVDGDAHRIYISRGTHMMVIDSESGQLVSDLPDTPGIHGMALVHKLGRGFTSNGRAGTVTIFDLKTLKAIGQVKVGENPDAILYDSVSDRVFTFNGRSHDTTAVDPAAGTAVGTIPLGGKPETGVADGKGHVYVNIEDKGEMVEFDSRELKVLNRWSMAPCESPTGLAMAVKKRRLFASCDKLMAVMDADSGKVITTLPIGPGADGAAFDPGTSLAFSTNGGDGTLSVVCEESKDKYTLVENVPTMPRARTVRLDPKTHLVYTVTAEFGPAPAATPENPRPRPTMVPNSFVVLVLGR